MASDESPPARKRDDDNWSPPQFTLRTIFIITAIVAVGCGVYRLWNPDKPVAAQEPGYEYVGDCFGQRNCAAYFAKLVVEHEAGGKRSEWSAAVLVGGHGRIAGLSFGSQIVGKLPGAYGMVDEEDRLHTKLWRLDHPDVFLKLPRHSIAWVDSAGIVTQTETNLDGEAVRWVVEAIQKSVELQQRLDGVADLKQLSALIEEIAAKRDSSTGIHDKVSKRTDSPSRFDRRLITTESQRPQRCKA